MCQLITLVDILWERVLQLCFGKERIHWAVYHPEESSHKNNLHTVPYALSLEVMLRNRTVRAELGWPLTDEEKIALAGTYNDEMVTQAKSSGLTWSGGCSSYSNTFFFPSPLLMCDPSSHRKCHTDGSSAPHLADNCFMSPLRHFLSSIWATFSVVFVVCWLCLWSHCVLCACTWIMQGRAPVYSTMQVMIDASWAREMIISQNVKLK